jgi:hypothetical protein
MGKQLTPDVEDLEDVSRFCRGSWLHQISTGSVAYIGQVDTSYVYYTKGPNPYTEAAQKHITFEKFIEDFVVGVPDHGYVKHNGRVFYVKVNTRDKMAQGYRGKASQVVCLNKDAEDIMRENVETISQLFFPSFVKFDVAMESLQKGDSLGEVLSPHVAIITPKTGPYEFYYQNTLIGHIVKGAPVLLGKFSAMHESVSKVCQSE